ncbi:FMN phosphatase YigB (HAD superfamily) [Parabacteroides sp. PF5-5]|nr:FMN phosphatase YigB (HAD superfamily) [Parabacteroides sp. PH5-39]MDH6315815.1 FMN phosphatase YigB (HAD superfamily) [Parabacteroides sp. PF5-13]MDH6319474.1 FMN phosphatase YigB (HAD superfamily) [Parabacteroides sp. PH5-13]MDH6323205.1 FMN phosphatase YigB (HAD superfamily) [Parabacteroides sp. PH5-8]MDH6327007.1 FMN phosphatase YigB (HAD superfamily) [Parabacteroides sp. PH5-41]MDH6334563.1 FMN phosphatase YigB (HAD superfamily) [Parabacteroides sp. PF5-5]MDH6345628.1 FMN phosphatase 
MAIKNVVFDLGGVIIDLDSQEPIRRFKEIGVKDADELLDAYEQKGIFLEIEDGKISVEEFCEKLRAHAGKDLTFEQIAWAWLGFVVDVPQYKLDFITQLREKYKVYLLSNTNPIIQEQWARTNKFSEAGRPINDYFDKMYTSYEVGVTKPSSRIFEYMIKDSGMLPSETLFVDDGAKNIEVGKSLGMYTYQPLNGEDWRNPIDKILQETR